MIIENIDNVYAIISYPSITQRLQNVPNYCIIPPSGTTAAEQANLEQMAINGVTAWNNKLQNYETTNPSIWEMDSTIVSSKDDTAGCDITINFKSTVQQLENKEGHVTVGVFDEGAQSIDVAYQNYSLDIIFNILIHEIGHSLGLGHYVSDDNAENEKWYSGKVFSPSIMIPTTNNNPSMMDIMEVDVLKVREIYGTNGFYAFSPTPTPSPLPTPQPTPSPTPTPTPIPKSPIIPIKPIKSIQISDSSITVSKYQTKYEKISGQIESSFFHQGISVFITIKNPESGFTTHKIVPTKTGYFELPLVFDGNWKTGWYEVEVSYMEQSDYDMNFLFHVENSPLPSNTQTPRIESVPSLQSGQYLKNIHIESKDNQYTVTSSIVSNIESIHSVRIVAENECPTKKEVMRKDFVFNPEKEFSFSFYQLSQGKPDECAIHFTLSDFDGNVIEEVVTNYKVDSSHDLQSAGKRIPDWIKNNVSWWSEGKIDDRAFVQGIQFLIKENIIHVQAGLESSSSSNEIPSWVKNNAKWWADGQITEDDFLKGMEHLVKIGIIHVQ